MKSTNAQQIANCIAGTVVCVVFAPFLTVMSFRTLTLFEIRPDKMYKPSDCLKTSFRERIIWIAGFKKNEILKSQRLNFTF